MDYESVEIWKQIPVAREGYMASTFGRIRSPSQVVSFSRRGGKVRNLLKGRVLVCNRPTKKGYLRVNICGVTYQVHRLIGMTFLDNPDELPQINHKNGVKTDNRVTNLEWVTNLENRTHAVLNNLHAKGNKCSKFTEEDIKRMRDQYLFGASQRCISSVFNCAQQTVSKIVLGTNWKHIDNRNHSKQGIWVMNP